MFPSVNKKLKILHQEIPVQLCDSYFFLQKLSCRFPKLEMATNNSYLIQDIFFVIEEVENMSQ